MRPSEPAWSHHCGDIWRAAVLAAGGGDICDVVGPSPRSAAEWAAMMRRLGVRSLAGVISAVHGPPLRLPRLAKRGDIVRRGWAIGVCRGEVAEFYDATLSMREVDDAWSARQDEPIAACTTMDFVPKPDRQRW
ncbi:DUF6950 family protein [Novosphingobium fluoreni]|uniref:DUF6950 family protein n=1 Tax=Novosphingobium fluoreni TaxID=1391222 RepID=UPI003DA11AC8